MKDGVLGTPTFEISGAGRRSPNGALAVKGTATEGELVVCVVPSGGKPTLLRMVAGLESVTEGELCLFDEPLSNLDAKLRKQMRLEIKKLRRELGVAAIHVTHDQVEATTLADRIVVLDLGEVVPPRSMPAQPRSSLKASSAHRR